MKKLATSLFLLTALIFIAAATGPLYHGSFVDDGSGRTSIPATNLTGTINPTNLPALSGDVAGPTTNTVVTPVISRNYPNLIWRGLLVDGATLIANEHDTLVDMTNMLNSSWAIPNGYNTLLLEYGWCYGRDTNTGKLYWNSNNFPSGPNYLWNICHSNGINVVIYFDTAAPSGGNYTIAPYPNLYPSGIIAPVLFSNDCETFKAWGATDGLWWDDIITGFGDIAPQLNISNWFYFKNQIIPQMPFYCNGSSITNWDGINSTPKGYVQPGLNSWPQPVTNLFGTLPIYDLHKLPAWRVQNCDAAYYFADGQSSLFLNGEWDNFCWQENAGAVYGNKYHIMGGSGALLIGSLINFQIQTGVTMGALCHQTFQLFGEIELTNTAFAPWLYLLTNSAVNSLQRDPLNNLPYPVFYDGHGGSVHQEQTSKGMAVMFVNSNASYTDLITYQLSSAGVPSGNVCQVIDLWNNITNIVTNSFSHTETNQQIDLFLIQPVAPNATGNPYSAVILSITNIPQDTNFSYNMALQNFFIGPQAGNYPNVTGIQNAALGLRTMQNITSGQVNTAIGFDAGYSIYGAGYNVYVGAYSGVGNAGNNNTFVGTFSGDNSSGGDCAAFGNNALYSAGGNCNSAFGQNAGYNNSGSGTNNLYLGANQKGSANDQNMVYIGVPGTASNVFYGVIQATGGFGSTATNYGGNGGAFTTGGMTNTNAQYWVYDVTLSTATVYKFDSTRQWWATNTSLSASEEWIVQPNGGWSNSAGTTTITGAHAF